MYDKELKNVFREEKINIYIYPLFERIMIIFSAIGFLALTITGFILDYVKDNPQIFPFLPLLLCAMVFSVFAFFEFFTPYIRLDFKLEKIIIRDHLNCFKKEELDLSRVKEIKITDDVYVSYTIDVICAGFTKKLILFERERLPLFLTYKKQRKRFLKLAQKCNSALEEYRAFTNKNMKNKNMDDTPPSL